MSPTCTDKWRWLLMRQKAQAAPEPLSAFLKQKGEMSAVPVVEEDGLTGVSAKGHMVERP